MRVSGFSVSGLWGFGSGVDAEYEGLGLGESRAGIQLSAHRRPIFKARRWISMGQVPVGLAQLRAVRLI